MLQNTNLDRCFKPPRFGRLIDCSLHHFSDASQDAYGQVLYLRLVDEDSHINYSLAMAKSRVTPLKFVSIPRLELTAATLSIKVNLLLKKELSFLHLTCPTSVYNTYCLGHCKEENERKIKNKLNS